MICTAMQVGYACTGGPRESSAGFPFACDIERNSCCTCGGANSGLDPRFLRLMEPRIAERLGAAAIGPRPGKEQVPPAYRTASRRGQRRPIGRRLYQSDLAALGGGSCEEIRRDFVGRQGLSDPAEPVLAGAGAFRLYKLWNADTPAAGQDHHPLPLRSSIPPSAPAP